MDAINMAHYQTDYTTKAGPIAGDLGVLHAQSTGLEWLRLQQKAEREADEAAEAALRAGLETHDQALRRSRRHSQQLQQLFEPATLQPTGVHTHQTKAFWHQLCFEAIGHANPAHKPQLFNGFSNC